MDAPTSRYTIPYENAYRASLPVLHTSVSVLRTQELRGGYRGRLPHAWNSSPCLAAEDVDFADALESMGNDGMAHENGAGGVKVTLCSTQGGGHGGHGGHERDDLDSSRHRRHTPPAGRGEESPPPSGPL